MSTRGWKALDGVGVGDSVREIAIPMDKRAIHLVDKLNFQNYGQEERVFTPFQRDLNRRMIDLAEQAGAEFSSNRKFGTLPYLKLLYTLEKRKRSLGRKRNTIWFLQMVLFENSTPHATPEYV
jgi:hypothetical protein